MRNIRCLFSAAVNCYCDSSSYSIVRTVDEGGNANIVLSYKQDVVFDYEQTDVYIDTETYDSQSYASGAFKRQNGALLPIDYIQETMSVRTSNQLYLALSMGYRPVPVAGSSAETVYNAMKAVLIRISSDSFTDAQKVHAIYDYLSTEVCYDYDILDIIDYYDKNPNPLFNSNVYECFYLEGVFLRGRAVCDGIAKAFNSLCWMEGVTAKKISGEETRSNVGHAWNKVFVDGSWYGVDSTWGSTRAGTTEEWQNHKYMMTTDAILNVQHNTYGMSPATSTTAYMGYYESTNWEGADVEDIDHVIKSVDEAKDFTDDYATPALDSVGDFIYVEIYLDGITYNDFYQTFVNNFAYSVGVSKIDLGDNYVLIIMTRRPDQVQ